MIELNSTLWIPDSMQCIPDSFSVEHENRIPIVSGILDSLSCIQDSKAQDSGFHNRKFADSGFHKQKNSWIPESGFPVHVGN